EAMNVLPLLKTNFVDICMAMVEGSLSRKRIAFDKKSTVCKYVVPQGYGVKSEAGKEIRVDEEAIQRVGGLLFYASVNEENGKIYTTTSRSLAVVGIADEITEAELICERCLQHVSGDIFIRHDIGTQELLERRISHMAMLRG
ncbi:MAG TPA: phosphoribosylamine--glycine ligase, partial [Thermoplasmatales archaeon]|nr:phosphoribosylamine--glycine ligase [Thermoplasmatales archaeon]